MESNMSFDKQTNRNPFFEQMEKEILALIDPDTQSPYSEIVENIKCPSCGHAGKYFLTKWHFTYQKCPHCSLIFVNPRIKEDLVLDAYRTESIANAMWAESVNTSSRQKQFYKKYFKEQLDLVKTFRESGRLLDVGCGNGQFLSYAKENRFNVKGVELETNALKIAREQGLDVQSMLLTDHQLNQQQFDIITMFGVMEHLVDPRRDISFVQNMLDSDGIFMAITPNAQSLVGMLLHEKARFYTPRNHPLIFCMNSIQYLLENTGFEILHLDTVLTGYDSIVNFLQYREPFSDIDTSFLPQSIRQLVLNKSQCEQMILDWHLGLRLRVIARKK